MTDLADRALVRIFREDRPVGMGFLVGPDLIVTCAHVVGAQPRLGDFVTVDFPTIDAGTYRNAWVVHISESATPEAIIGLRVASTPVAATAVRVVATTDVRNHRVRAFGVPDNRGHGVWSHAVVRGPIADGLIHVEDDRSHGLPLLRGFSGSPLIDDDLSAVIGMVVSVESRPERRTGYALSGASLYDAWPELTGFAPRPNPFRGLEPFGIDDAEEFFGRTQQATDLVENLEVSGLAVVGGPSGSGKSSFVLAGVLPRLRADAVATIVIRPGAGGPWRSLAGALADLMYPERADLTEIDHIAQRLAEGQAEDLVNRVLVRGGLRRLVIVVDQLDEAVVRYYEELVALLSSLFRVIDTYRHDPSVRVLVTVSPGPLERLLVDARIGQQLTGHTVILGTPGGDELREIIECPLAAVGMPKLQVGLIDRLLADVTQERNPLAMLEFCLTLLWERQERGQLTHDAYRDLGELSGVVSGYAESVWERSAATGDRFRILFSQLVSPLPGGGVVRRVVALSQLGELSSLAEDLADTRLLTISSGPDGVTVELAHESLVRYWGRLGGWVAEDSEFRLWQDGIDAQTQRWVESGDKSLLLRGRSLSEALAVHSSRRAELTADQRRFLAASKFARMKRAYWRTVVASTVVALVLSVVLVVVQVVHYQADDRAMSAADVLSQRGRQDDAAASLPLAARAFRTADLVHTRERLREWSRYARHAVALIPNADRDASSSPANPTGMRAAVRTMAGDLEVWDLAASPPRRLSLPGDGIALIDWLGPDRVVGSVSGKRVVVWDARTGRVVREFDAAANLVAGDVRGHWIAYGSAGSPRVHLVDMKRPGGPATTLTAPGKLAFLRQAPAGSVFLRDVLPSGAVLVENTSGRRFLLTSAGRRALAAVPGRLIELGGDQPATVDCEKDNLVMRGVVSGAELARYRDPTAGCRDGALFSSDGRVVALLDTVGFSPSLHVGPVNGSASLRRVPVPGQYWVDRVWADDDDVYHVLLRGLGSDLAMRIPPPDPFEAALSTALRAEVTHSGEHVVVEPDKWSLEVWSVATRRRVGHAPARRSGISPAEPVVEVSPSDRILARVASEHEPVTVLRLPDLAPLATLAAPRNGHADLWFLDDRRLAVLRQNMVTVWDAESGRPIGAPIRLRSPDPQRGLSAVRLVAPVDDDEVVMATGDGEISRYKIADGSEVAGSDFTHDSGVPGGESVTVHPTEHLMAVTVEGRVDIWNLDTHEREARLVLPEGVSPVRLRFRDDPDALEITVIGGGWYARVDVSQGSMILLWERNRWWGVPKILGQSDERLQGLAGVPAEPGHPNAGSYELGGFESANPADWLAGVCRLIRDSGLDMEPANLPDGSWRGPVCN